MDKKTQDAKKWFGGSSQTLEPQGESPYLQAIVESSDDAIIGKTLDGTIKSWNKGAEKIYGYSSREVIGKSISILIPKGTKDEVPEILEKIRKGSSVSTFETVRITKNGKTMDVSMTVSPIKDNLGNIIGASTIARDVTERKRQDEIRSRYTRSLIESSLDPLVTISPEGKITDVNEASAKVTGIPREKLIGTDFLDYFTEPEKAREGYKQVFAKGLVSDYPLTIRHKDGKLTDVLYNASVYKDDKGNVLGVCAAARDVTVQKQASKKVAESTQELQDKVAELERLNRVMVGRELKMIELKKEIDELKAKL